MSMYLIYPAGDLAKDIGNDPQDIIRIYLINIFDLYQSMVIIDISAYSFFNSL